MSSMEERARNGSSRPKRDIGPIRGMKIQTKLTLIILIAVMIPIVIVSAVFAGRLYDMVISETIRQEQNLIPEMVDEIDGLHEQLRAAKDKISREPLYEQLFSREITEGWDEITASDEMRSFVRCAQGIIADTPVTAVRIYLKQADPGILSGENAGDIFHVQDEVHTYWRSVFTANPTLIEFFCSQDYMREREREELGDCALIYRVPYTYQGAAATAYLALYYSSDDYVNIMERGLTVQDSVSYIIDEREMNVAYTDRQLRGLYNISSRDIENSLNSSNSFVETEIQKKTVYIALYKIQNLSDMDWYLVSVIPEEPLIDIANQGMVRFTAICVACVLLAVVFAVWLSGSITRRIAAVADQMAKVHEGPPEPMDDPTVHDEVGALVDSYNYMTKEMNELIEVRERTAEELRIAEFNALQAQINPHFLYNTMDMINWMAVQGKNEEVSRTVQDLARFYKLTLSRKKSYSLIRDELEHARIYLQLQNRRFNDAIEFVVDIPDDLLEYRIPRLTFQPILENAILHGILEKEDKTGTVLLTGWTEGTDILILISDDGVGMEKDILDNILSPERKSRSGGTNIAIVNIHERLKLLYGSRYGLSFRSAPGQGCEVTIHVPMHSGDTPYVRPED